MSKKMNIILLMTDQLRPEYVGYAARSKMATPNIDRIAEGTSFSSCQTVNPVCTPARTAMMTGKYTHQIGMLAMSGDLGLHHPTYPQALRKAGYWTAGIGKFHYLQTWKWGAPRGHGVDLAGIRDRMKEYGYDHVWETSGKQLTSRNRCDFAVYMEKKGLLDAYRDYIDASGPNFNTPDSRPDKDGDNTWPFDEADHVDILTGDEIIRAMDIAPADKPFFVMGSFCSPHRPFDPPQRYLDMIPEEAEDDFIEGDGTLSDEDKALLYRKRRAYKATIKLVDDQVGRVFAWLKQNGKLDDTVVLFTCDHGEMMGDHFRLQKSEPYRASATVPAAIRHPGHLAGLRNSTPVELTDFTATILDIAGIDPQAALSKEWPAFNDIVPCRSLLPVVTGAAERIREYSFTEYGNGSGAGWQMIQSEKWKYVRYLDYDEPGKAPEQLFDLEHDPDEVTNLAADPAFAEALAWCRARREFVMDTTPPAQTRWAPLMGDDGTGYGA